MKKQLFKSLAFLGGADTVFLPFRRKDAPGYGLWDFRKKQY